MPVMPIVIAVVALLVIACQGMLVLSLYRKCGPSQAMIVTGMGAAPGSHMRVILGGGGTVVFPSIQMVSYLDLSMHRLEISQRQMRTKDGVSVSANAVMHYKVKAEPTHVVKAAQAFLGKAPGDVENIARDLVATQLAQKVSELSAAALDGSWTELSVVWHEACFQPLEELGLVPRAAVILSMTQLKS